MSNEAQTTRVGWRFQGGFETAFIGAAMIATLALFLPGGAAMAHAVIVGSSPAPYAHVAAGELAVTLRYNSRVDAGRSKLLLKHGQDLTRLTVGEAPTPDVLRTTVAVTPGDDEIRWQVLAVDGHVTRGRIPFTVDAGRGAGAAK